MRVVIYCIIVRGRSAQVGVRILDIGIGFIGCTITVIAVVVAAGFLLVIIVIVSITAGDTSSESLSIVCTAQRCG